MRNPEHGERTRSEHGTVGVLVVDDQLIFRHVAHEVIDMTKGFELLGHATSGEHAVAAAEELEPDLVLLDVRMPGMDGIETARRLRDSVRIPVVVLISIEEPPNLPAGIESCGAVALVRKQDFRPALLRQLWRDHAPART